MAAIPEARRALEDVGMADEIDLVVAGGIRNGGDVAKCLALGAKAVAIGHSALMALNCNKEIPGVTDYLGTVGKEVLETFFTTDRSQDYLAMQFTVAPHVNPEAEYMRYWENRYAHARSNTHVVQPWAYFMFLYQEPVWFPGWVFFLVMASGLVLVIRRWRGWGRYAAA